MKTLCLSLLTLFILAGHLCAYDFVGYLEGASLGDQFGSSVTEADFNGDGIKDLIIGSPSADDAGTSSGRVDIYFGGTGADLIADVTLIGSAGSFFGSSLSSAGDFNGDGFDDLLVGAPFYDLPQENAGAAFLFYGGPAADTVVDHIFTGEDTGDYFGISVTSAGDFNNDTNDDIAIGAYHADLRGYENIGKTYVYYGGIAPDFDVDEILVGDAEGERSGFTLTTLDFNGDAVSDIAVGAYSYDGLYINQGRVYIYFGGVNPDASYDITITGDSAGYEYGWSLSSGRINDDSYDDLVMGVPEFPVSDSSAGKVYVYYGGPGYNAYPDYTYTLGRAANDFLGHNVFAGVDLNSDGYDELIAGMPGNDDGAADAGGAVLISGGATPSVDTSFLGNSSSEEMGQAVCIWSAYGDNSLIVCGAPDWNSFTGRVHLYSTTTVSNSAPNLDPVGDKFVAIDHTLQFQVTASDPNSDSVTIEASNLPTGASFDFVGYDNGLGKYRADFSWTPGTGDEGIYDSILFMADDGELVDTEYITITVGNFVCGDADANGYVDIDDVVYLITYIFGGGPAPDPLAAGDADCTGYIDIDDVVYLINYIFGGGPTPCDPDGDHNPDC